MNCSRSKSPDRKRRRRSSSSSDGERRRFVALLPSENNILICYIPGMTGGEVEVAREENGASLEGEERGAGVFLGRGGGDDF